MTERLPWRYPGTGAPPDLVQPANVDESLELVVRAQDQGETIIGKQERDFMRIEIQRGYKYFSATALKITCQCHYSGSQ